MLAEEADTLTRVAERMSKALNKKVTMNNLSRKLCKETIKFVEVDMLADLLGYDVKFEKRKQ